MSTYEKVLSLYKIQIISLLCRRHSETNTMERKWGLKCPKTRARLERGPRVAEIFKSVFFFTGAVLKESEKTKRKMKTEFEPLMIYVLRFALVGFCLIAMLAILMVLLTMTVLLCILLTDRYAGQHEVRG